MKQPKFYLRKKNLAWPVVATLSLFPISPFLPMIGIIEMIHLLGEIKYYLLILIFINIYILCLYIYLYINLIDLFLLLCAKGYYVS